MAFTYADMTAEPRSWSTGPVKEQHVTFSRLSTDTSGTVTFDALSRLDWVEIHGAGQSALATITNNGAVLALNATTADGVGTIVGYGR